MCINIASMYNFSGDQMRTLLYQTERKKRCFMMKQMCTITCHLRKSLHAAHLLTKRPIGYPLTNCLLTTTNLLSPPVYLLSLSLTTLWGGHPQLRYTLLLMSVCSLHVPAFKCFPQNPSGQWIIKGNSLCLNGAGGIYSTF